MSPNVAACLPNVTICVRRGSVRTLASTGAASRSSTSLSERTVVSTASRTATTSRATTSPIARPSRESRSGDGDVLTAEFASSTTTASLAFRVCSSSSRFSCSRRSDVCGSPAASDESFAFSCSIDFAIGSPESSARQTTYALAAAFAIATARSGSLLDAVNVTRSLSPAETVTLACSSEALPSDPPVRSAASS